jgi:DNA-binding transcriptional LysR family regulator
MDARQLEYFVAITETGGFTKAAQALGVAQPSVSQAIHQLEAELGSPLFHRIGRSVTLTATGEALVDPARRVLRDVDVARAAAAAVSGLHAGRLDLVALPTVAADPLAGLIGRFRSAHPKLVVRVMEPDAPNAVIEAVASGRAEIGLGEVPLPSDADDELVAALTIRQELFVVAPPDAGEFRRRGVRPEDLADRPLLATPPGTSSRRLVDAALEAAGVTPFIAVETAQRESLVPLVLAGAGVAVLPEPTARRAAADGAVIARLDPPLRRTLGFVHRRSALSPAATAFLELCRGVLANKGSGSTRRDRTA